MKDKTWYEDKFEPVVPLITDKDLVEKALSMALGAMLHHEHCPACVETVSVLKRVLNINPSMIIREVQP